MAKDRWTLLELERCSSRQPAGSSAARLLGILMKYYSEMFRKANRTLNGGISTVFVLPWELWVAGTSETNYVYSPNIVRVIKSRRMRWAGHVARMDEERGAYRVLVGKPEGKRPLGRPRRRWVDNIRMDLQEVGCGYVDWIGLAQDRDRWRTLLSAVMNLQVP